MERKQYGLELYEAGVAKRLLLSVGRFEVSKMRSWNLPFVPGLIAARDAVRPDQRHFFCELTGDETRITRPNLLRWNTYGEVRGLREHLGKRLPNSIIVISTDIHLRRIAVTFQKVFAGSGVRLQYCPVPPAQSSLRKERWWTRRQDRKYVLSETVKLIGYQVASGFTRGAR